MTQDLYRLVYCSRNALSDTEATAEVRRILAVSRRNNAAVAVTGALLFTSGIFAQVLEGPLAQVEQTFERIQTDPRHADVTVLQISCTEQRAFADWSMGFAGGDAAPASLSALRLDRAFQMPDGDGTAAADVMDLLRTLVRTEENWAA